MPIDRMAFMAPAQRETWHGSVCAALRAGTLAAMVSAAPISHAGAQSSVRPLETSAEAAGWRVARAPAGSGQGGTAKTAITVTRTVDPRLADIEVAGFMFRCVDGETDALVIMLVPFSPSAKPQVAIETGRTRVNAEAVVLPTGASLKIPRELIPALTVRGGGEAEVTIRISEGPRSLTATFRRFHGAAAFDLIQPQCHSM